MSNNNAATPEKKRRSSRKSTAAATEAEVIVERRFWLNLDDADPIEVNASRVQSEVNDGFDPLIMPEDQSSDWAPASTMGFVPGPVVQPVQPELEAQPEPAALPQADTTRHTHQAVARSTVTRVNSETKETQVLSDSEIRSEVTELVNVRNVARVTISGGVTINMGNFEFIRADASVEMPCLPDAAALDDAHAFAKAKVGEYIADDVEAYKQRLATL